MGTSKSVILIADDNPMIRSLVRRILGDSGYIILEAENGQEAMDLLHSGPADLLITDLVMPEKEGLELIRLCRREYPQLKIMAVSGAFQGNFLRAAELMGADAAICKPFDPESFRKTVARLLSAACLAIAFCKFFPV